MHNTFVTVRRPDLEYLGKTLISERLFFEERNKKEKQLNMLARADVCSFNPSPHTMMMNLDWTLNSMGSSNRSILTKPSAIQKAWHAMAQLESGGCQ